MAPQRSHLSAREAAALLGFGSANPILSAIKSGELAAEKLPGRTRNGRNSGAYQITREDLDAYAAARGITADAQPAELPAAPEADGIPELPAETFSNVVGIVGVPRTRTAAAGEPMVTVPLALLLDLQARVSRAETLLELREQPSASSAPAEAAPISKIAETSQSAPVKTAPRRRRR